MKIRLLLFIVVACMAPGPLRAQPATESVRPATPVAPSVVPLVTPAVMPKVARAPRVASAQAPPAPELPPTAPAVAQAPAAPKPASAPAPLAAPAPPARFTGQLLNIQIEVTLTDSKGSTKVLTMTAADGESAMNRTGTTASTNYFNADGRPVITGNKIRLNLTAEAAVMSSPREAGDKPGSPPLNLRQSQTLILNDGVVAEIARATDPTSDRVFALSVKATIQR